MATVIEVPDMRRGYLTVLGKVFDDGRYSEPRGEPTFELLDTIIVLTNPHDALPVGIGRKLNPAIAVAEALQLIGGFSDPELMTRISPNFKQFLDENRFWGAYGERIGTQLDAAVRKLRNDPDTRQAVITLWSPGLDNVDGMKDYPCTVMLQLLIRDDRLILHTTMRSNDIWLGLPHDAFQFTQLQLTIARTLGIEAGPYHHHAVSLHMYKRDADAIEDLIGRSEQTLIPEECPHPADGVGKAKRGLHDTRRRARDLAQGIERLDSTASEQWYLEQLGKYL